MNKRFIGGVILAAALSVGITGCSGSGQDAKPTKTPSASATNAPLSDADVRVPDEKADAACTDGSAVIDQSNTEVTLPGACATVVVNANNAVVHLGDVTELTVNGGLTRVLVDSAETVRVIGNGNDVLWNTTKPLNIDDRGSRNFIQKHAK